MGLQVAVAIGVPLLACTFGGNSIDDRLGSKPWGLLIGILLGLIVGAGAMAALLRDYLSRTMGTATESARAAGQRWDSEIQERERRRESGEDEEDR